ncbi:TRADD-N-associated membrane domain-containing protein [Glutamicibacter halophytocola]|uniref:TRADD-N-associated membrane domain-containing protein n=1 Tax=Glutamicibacter halophytocola TaxID=1933880 RepID=UPI0015C56BAC|nr:hypothetical protein [Glutamicibacter halophytocola]NQD39974.1 hypothetical protein [Glutamicibacter halophytocola]
MNNRPVTPRPSKPKKNSKRSKGLETFLTLSSRVILLTLIGTTFFIIPFWNPKIGEVVESPDTYTAMFISLSFVVLTSFIVVFQLHISRRSYEVKRASTIIRLENIEKQEQEIAQSSPRDDISLPKLWALNNQRISSYHTAAVDQSVRSFLSTQIATYSGLLVILAAAGFAAFANNTIATISAGAVGVIGGGLSAFISSTFMKSQAAATEQLQRFFNHPVELSRMLSAERLLKDLNDEDRSEATKLIIKAMLEGHLNETTNRGSNEK